MATSVETNHPLAAKPDLASENGNGSDPFSTSGASNHYRFSHFDNQLFALGPAASPEQAKRALEAHLAETERRIQDASKLGTALVQQRKELSDRLIEVEKQQSDRDIPPELRQKLVEIEKGYNEVGMESARAFLPKTRVLSGEIAGSPLPGVEKRSISPSKFESQATSSPSKLTVPNRKQRNQPSNRVHDIEFATEISTSLLAQVRHLQSLLSEKEEALRVVTLDKSKLEAEAEGFHQQLRSLDESEHRYKDENWNLETQIHEHIASAKDAADREKKLTQSLHALQSEKAAAQKELDEIKLGHAKLAEDHAATIKQHDAELGGVKRSMTTVENDRNALQRKIDELTGQNQELAMALAGQRGRSDERDNSRGLSDEDFETANDNISSEHSPPPSPIKGTPRHSMLESETLKSSLQHAHRMIQNLKGNIHREKTEKLELKRMLQDARDELESRRDGGLASGTAKRTRKVESREFKKPLKPGQLGGLRSSHSEIAVDENWEDHHGQDGPVNSTFLMASGAAAGGVAGSALHEFKGRFDASNETSDVFETANERSTETEDFHTGYEDLSGSDELTETETGPDSRSKKPTPIALTKAGNRQSFQSTASLSGDEYSYEDAKTPVPTQPQRMRLKMGRGDARRSRLGTEGSQFASSPASFADSSTRGTPQEPQSLFAELGDLNGTDEDESVEGTPSRRNASAQSGTPFSRPSTAKSIIDSPVTPSPNPLTAKSIDESQSDKLTSGQIAAAAVVYSPSTDLPTKPIMTDSGMMTEDWSPPRTSSHRPVSDMIGAGIAGAGLAAGARILLDNRVSTSSSQRQSDATVLWHDEQLNNIHLLAPGIRDSRPISTSTYSDVSSQAGVDMDEKLAKFPAPPTSPVSTSVDNMSNLAITAAPLTMSSIVTEQVEPASPKFAVLLPPFAFSSINSVATEPVEPTTPVRSPRRDGVIIPRDESSDEPISKSSEIKTEKPEIPKDRLGSLFGWSNTKHASPPVIAEDETCVSPSIYSLADTPEPQGLLREISANANDNPISPSVYSTVETPEPRRPFREMSTNANDRAVIQPKILLKDEGSQTTMTADQIKSMEHFFTAGGLPIQPLPPAVIPPTSLKLKKSAESFGSVSHARLKMAEPDFARGAVVKRPGSANSNRAGSVSNGHPPLPTNHQQTIAAAAHRAPSSTVQGAMGPPPVPAPGHRSNPSFRPRTPSQSAGSATKGETTPRAVQPAVVAEVYSPTGKSTSRRSSITSFASELDVHFNTAGNGLLGSQGTDSGTDPRMIQAITQTMIGEYLWKYTRKAGRGEMSENRHRRYFWVHPYTRTLYWSDRDPSTAGREELKAKSVAIEAVRVVTDDNPMPPGLHRKSLIVLTPGRAVKFTASTGQRHETWFNALSYLLLRTDGTVNDTEEVMTGAITREDVDEFNPGQNSRPLRGRMPSLSSYNSRTTRTESPTTQSVKSSMKQPTLMHSSSTSNRATGGTLTRLSSYWKDGGAFSSYRGRYSLAGDANFYEASEVHDSAEDLREIYEKQDRESDRLENVRACCDGKHDVSSLSHSSHKGRHSNHIHAPAGLSGPKRQELIRHESIPEAVAS